MRSWMLVSTSAAYGTRNLLDLEILECLRDDSRQIHFSFVYIHVGNSACGQTSLTTTVVSFSLLDSKITLH